MFNTKIIQNLEFDLGIDNEIFEQGIENVSAQQQDPPDILMKTFNRFGEDVQVIGHYHDGNTLAVKRHLKDVVIGYYGRLVIR